MEVTLLLTVCVSLRLAAAQSTECADSKLLPRADNRYLFNRISADDVNINDDSALATGWYKTDGIQILQTKPAEAFMCGTKFPVYYQGTLPTSIGQTVQGRACVFNNDNMCYNVQISMCADNSFRYHLERLAVGSAAYCFGEGVDGTKPDYVPTLQAISVRRIQMTTPTIYSQARFTCNFRKSTTNTNLFYRVIWYNGNSPAYLTPFGQDPSELELTEELFVSEGFKMGASISCAARAYNVQDGPPGALSERSTRFFVGLRVNKQEISFQLDAPEADRTFTLTPTVPIGCMAAQDCRIFLGAVTPPDPDTQCNGVTVTGQCGINLESQGFPDRSFKLVVQAASTGLYQANTGRYRIILKTGGTLENLIWGNYELSPVFVNILKSPAADVIDGKTCYSRNDPHMSSFDGKRYEMQNRDDVYVLYRNEAQNSEVQLQVQSCGNNNRAPRCNCGIAVRSGNDLYVASICRSNPNGVVFDFKNCQDQSITVQRSPRNQFEYQIVFEYGTRVEFYINGNYMNYVQVKPSVYDQKMTSQTGSLGLCGVLNGNQGDDFTDRNGNTVEVTAFTESWRVPAADNLFINDPAATPPKPVQVCLCDSVDQNQATGIKSGISCATNAVANCLRQVTKAVQVSTKSCDAPSRTRRSIYGRGRKPFIPAPDPVWSNVRVRRQTVVYTNETARAFCTNFMQNSQTYQFCQNVPNIDPAASLETCILDLVATDDITWAQANLDSMQSSCLTEVISNVTLWTPPSPGVLSIRETMEKMACPSNCSDRGVCNEGNCDCVKGFGATDCSIDLGKPPTLQGIFNDGLCDEAETQCTEVYAFGVGFVDSPDLTCQLQEFYLEERQRERQLLEVSTISGRLDTFIEVVCSLENITVLSRSDTQFVSGYRLSVSNNGNMYSEPHEVFLYDSTCQMEQGVGESRTFVLKDGYCFINASCVENNDMEESNKCQVCDAKRNKFEWSVALSVEGCSKDSGVKLGLEKMAVIIVAIFVKYFML